MKFRKNLSLLIAKSVELNMLRYGIARENLMEEEFLEMLSAIILAVIIAGLFAFLCIALG